MVVITSVSAGSSFSAGGVAAGSDWPAAQTNQIVAKEEVKRSFMRWGVGRTISAEVLGSDRKLGKPRGDGLVTKHHAKPVFSTTTQGPCETLVARGA
jgi:hypothetical protein